MVEEMWESIEKLGGLAEAHIDNAAAGIVET